MLTYPIRILLLALVVCLAGCGRRPPVVQGEVTLNGKALEEGYITFFPTEGVQSPGKCEIKDGRYVIATLTPGDKRVLITMHPKAEIITDSKGQQRPKITSAKELTPQTTGNNQVVTISGAEQTLHFHLEQQKR